MKNKSVWAETKVTYSNEISGDMEDHMRIFRWYVKIICPFLDAGWEVIKMEKLDSNPDLYVMVLYKPMIKL